jgi:hypothetical protein
MRLYCNLDLLYAPQFIFMLDRKRVFVIERCLFFQFGLELALQLLLFANATWHQNKYTQSNDHLTKEAILPHHRPPPSVFWPLVEMNKKVPVFLLPFLWIGV